MNKIMGSLYYLIIAAVFAMTALSTSVYQTAQSPISPTAAQPGQICTAAQMNGRDIGAKIESGASNNNIFRGNDAVISLTSRGSRKQ
ncbi:MAG: hypothetical protein ABI698_03105 [bacterium]